MPLQKLLVLFLLCCVACKNKTIQTEQKFDRIKWATKQDREYPYRDKMLTDLMNNYELHGVKKDSVLYLLGRPTRTDNGYLFYTVVQKHLGNTPFILHSKSLVIKLTKDSTVEWRKIHE